MSSKEMNPALLAAATGLGDVSCWAASDDRDSSLLTAHFQAPDEWHQDDSAFFVSRPKRCYRGRPRFRCEVADQIPRPIGEAPRGGAIDFVFVEHYSLERFVVALHENGLADFSERAARETFRWLKTAHRRRLASDLIKVLRAFR